MSDHTENANPPPRFCAERIAGKCNPHGNDYQDHYKPKWKRFPQIYRIPKTKKSGIRPMGHNAHHILCAASVGKFIVETKIRPSVDLTDWCVNKIENIKVLPLWGQWFMYYASQSGDLMKNPEPGSPTFVNRPMHKSDHDIYQKQELNPKLEKIATQIEENTEKHKNPAEDLVAALDDLIDFFASELDARAEREGGTHTAWVRALNDSTYTNWYQPFSMAANARPRRFPINREGDIWNKMERWIRALKRPGA